jgi:hypothetical protein
MDAVRRYAMFVDGDWVDTDDRFEIRSPATEEKFVHLDLSGRLDPRAYALLLSTPPS